VRVGRLGGGFFCVRGGPVWSKAVRRHDSGRPRCARTNPGTRWGAPPTCSRLMVRVAGAHQVVAVDRRMAGAKRPFYGPSVWVRCSAWGGVWGAQRTPTDFYRHRRVVFAAVPAGQGKAHPGASSAGTSMTRLPGSPRSRRSGSWVPPPTTPGWAPSLRPADVAIGGANRRSGPDSVAG